jgi:hypothetical protein
VAEVGGISAGIGFLWGCAGGVGSEILHIYLIREKPAPIWLKSPLYWLTTLAMVVIGGILVIAYVNSANSLDPLAAMQIGVSAPLLLRSLGKAVPKAEPGSEIN